MLLKHWVGLLWTSDRPVSKASTYTGQHRSTNVMIHALSGIRTHDPNNQVAKTFALDRGATVTGRLIVT
jgi:hypothetical protein